VSARDVGFLPGTLTDKTGVYEAPYFSVCRDLYGGDVGAYGKLKHRGTVEFMTTSFARGLTLDDCVVVVDECQNMRYSEIDTIVTRVGQNCRIVFIGDFRQSDLTYQRERRGILDFMRVARGMRSFSTVEFTHDDILRSDLVREYLIARDREGIEP
jgi:phosphate starvation-inducible protein PhoH